MVAQSMRRGRSTIVGFSVGCVGGVIVVATLVWGKVLRSVVTSAIVLREMEL